MSKIKEQDVYIENGKVYSLDGKLLDNKGEVPINIVEKTKRISHYQICII